MEIFAFRVGVGPNGPQQYLIGLTLIKGELEKNLQLLFKTILHHDALTTNNEKFAKLPQLVPRGTLSSELFEFLRYLYPFKSYGKFLVFRFACLFEILFLPKLQCL